MQYSKIDPETEGREKIESCKTPVFYEIPESRHYDIYLPTTATLEVANYPRSPMVVQQLVVPGASWSNPSQANPTTGGTTLTPTRPLLEGSLAKLHTFFLPAASKTPPVNTFSFSYTNH
jgi:hypothetical protein